MGGADVAIRLADAGGGVAVSATYMRRCAGKKRYESRQEAIIGRFGLEAASTFQKTQVSAYRCDQCLGWHLGGGSKKHISSQKFRGRRGVKRANKNRRGR